MRNNFSVNLKFCYSTVSTFSDQSSIVKMSKIVSNKVSTVCDQYNMYETNMNINLINKNILRENKWNVKLTR